MAGKPKVTFYVAVLIVILGLVSFAAYRAYGPQPDDVAGRGAGGAVDIVPPAMVSEVEDPSSTGITTVDEWTKVATETLPPVRGASNYTLQDSTVKFALNVWAGWAPIVLANNGHQAQKVWKTPAGNEFKLELQLIDNPVDMQEAFVTGGIQIGWSTLDMVPLFMERLVDNSGQPRDSRVMPRVMQQVDWSNGGDGIVVRQNIRDVKDLRGKHIVLAQNSPSHYFLLNMLVAAGIQPSEVKLTFTADAFQAAAAFVQSRDIDACVSWAPDIYRISEVPGNRLLVTTGTANRLIADVWFARADFARDHPDICEAIIRGVFDAMQDLKSAEKKQQAAQLMAAFYNFDPKETMEMFADAYSTGWGDNYQFFVNRNYLANFERVWNNSYNLYRRVGVIHNPRVNFDQVMDNTFIKLLGEEEKYQAQRSETKVFLPTDISDQQIEDTSFLTATHYIHFFPNSADMRKVITRTVDNRDVEEPYDPTVDIVLDKIGEQIGQFELSRIVIEGHTDSSMKGQVDEQLVKSLSSNRAASVRDELVTKYGLDENRFTVVGRGWERPVSSADAGNHAKNRRVEVRILPAEGQ